MAQIRTRELAASLAALAVDEHSWLDLPDGGCESIPVAIGSSYVSAAIDAVSPDTVVTFGRDGLTGHPDHMAVSRWVDAAVAQTATSTRVLHATMTASWGRRFAVLNQQTGVFGDVGSPTTPEDEIYLRVDLSPGLLDRKMTALRAQASQTSGLLAAAGEATYRAWWATEWFLEAPVSS
jgi:LmbE family N-acetylglucosaminyl deacetylase